MTYQKTTSSRCRRFPPVAKAEQLHAQARLYLVALGSSAQNEVDGLAAFLHAAFAIPVECLPTFQPPAEAYDGKRHQWVAENARPGMARQFPDIAQDQESRIIGIVDGDLYLPGETYLIKMRAAFFELDPGLQPNN